MRDWIGIGLMTLLVVTVVGGSVLLPYFGRERHFCTGVNAEVLNVRILEVGSPSALAFPKGLGEESDFSEISVFMRC